MDFGYLMLVFIAMAAVTFAERALPFAASKWLQKQRWVRDLGDFLPLAIMVLLTVHAATDAAVARDAAPTPEVVSIAFAFVLQWFLKILWFRSLRARLCTSPGSTVTCPFDAKILFLRLRLSDRPNSLGAQGLDSLR